MATTGRLVVPAAEEVLDAYFPVLDHGFIALKDYMGGDVTIEESARVSFSQEARHIHDTRGLIRYLMRHHHATPFEMVELRFHIGLPIFVMRQWIRHRTANVNEYSGRYSVIPLLHYTPGREDVCVQSKSNKQGRSVCVDDEVFSTYKQGQGLVRSLAKCHYQQAIGDDIAREIARIDLPLSTYTYCYWKIDLRNLFNVIALRADSHAQKEIQAYANVLAGMVMRLCPIAFDAFQDYQQCSVTFSQAELAGLRYLSHFHSSPMFWANPPGETRNDVNSVLASHGIDFTKSGGESREQREFWEKLAPRTKKNYELDMSTAQSPSYFEHIISEHAVEQP